MSYPITKLGDLARDFEAELNSKDIEMFEGGLRWNL